MAKDLPRDEELRRAKDAAEAATLARGQFLANVSHEMRTPLGAVIGFAKVLQRGGLTPETEEAISTIISNGDYLLSIINDILDLSKIDAGALKIERMVVGINEVLEEVRRIAEPSAEAKGLSFAIRVDENLPPALHTDPLRLRQILINLVSNSVKFTHEGSIEVQVGYDRPAQRVAFLVKDTGIGIAPDRLERVFQPFSQADSSTTREFGGTGLGLTISLKLALLLGGTLAVQSTPGVGSIFTLTLKDVVFGTLGNGSVEAAQARPAIDPQSLRGNVLIADDVKANQKLVSFLLKGTGLQLSFVENGKQAIEAVRKNSVDLILMDLQMPVMDGLTATRLLRSDGVSIPIIAFSANAMQEDIARCMQAGCTGYLAKPFRESEMLEVLSQALKLSGTLHNEQPAPRSKTVEDQEDDADIDSVEVASVRLEWIRALPAELAAIEQAFHLADFESIVIRAHSLRGAAGLLGFSEFAAIAAKLEGSAKTKQAEYAGAEIRLLSILADRL